MLDRSHIERVLKINGLGETASDEEIKSILLSANWHEDDVDTALTVLRKNVNTDEERIDTVHKVFHTDTRLNPESIESLLGIKVDMSSEELALRSSSRRDISIWQVVGIVMYSVLGAGIVLFGVMWYYKLGIFYPGV